MGRIRSTGATAGVSGRSARPGRKRREAEVIEAATRIFHERGYSDTSVEDIADALGLLKGSLYYYIDSKEDLLWAIVNDVHVDVQRLLAEATTNVELPPLDRLALYVREQVEYNARNVMKISVYYHDLDRLGPDRLAEIRGQRRAMTREMVKLLEEAQGRGEISPDVEPRVASHAIFATISGVYRWYTPRGRVSPGALADLFADYVLHGIADTDTPQLRRDAA